MSIKSRLDRLERAAPRPRLEAAPMDAGQLAEGMAAWVNDNRALDTYDGQSARAFVEALAELGMELAL